MLVHSFMSFIRRIKYARTTKSIIEGEVELYHGCVFGGHNRIKRGTSLANTLIGYGSYISEECTFQNCLIGKYTSIGQRVKVIWGDHPTDTFVSTHPAFYSTRGQAGFTYVDSDKYVEYKPQRFEQYSTRIGNDVWIGSDVRIMDGVSIGDGAIIAAGAIVTKDVADYSIFGGIPAKLIRQRFNPSQIETLQRVQWWNKSEDWIKKYTLAFENIDVFCELVEKQDE